VGAVSGGMMGSVSANTFTFSKPYNFLTSKGNISSELRLCRRIHWVTDPYVICETIHASVRVPVAVLSNAYVCGHSPAEIVGLTPSRGMDACELLVFCVVRGLSVGLISRPEESCRLWCVVVLLYRNLMNKEAIARVGPQRQKKNIHPYVIC
jgi:hypothetical protein